MLRKLRVRTPSEVVAVRSGEGGGKLGKTKVHHSRQPSVQGCHRMRVNGYRSVALAARSQTSGRVP